MIYGHLLGLEGDGKSNLHKTKNESAISIVSGFQLFVFSLCFVFLSQVLYLCRCRFPLGLGDPPHARPWRYKDVLRGFLLGSCRQKQMRGKGASNDYRLEGAFEKRIRLSYFALTAGKLERTPLLWYAPLRPLSSWRPRKSCTRR